MDPTYKGLPTPLPTIQRKRGPNLKLVALIAGGFLLLITILGMLFANSGSGNSEQNQRLLYRLEALIALTSGDQSNVKNDDLQKISAELSLILTGDQTTLKTIIPTVKSSKTLVAIKTAEADATTTEKLKTAAANGTYTATYKTVLQDKLSAMYALATTVSGSTSSTKFKNALATLNEHLTLYSNQLTSLD